MTVAILAMSGNLDEARLLLKAIANGIDRKSDLIWQASAIFYPYQTPSWL